MQTIYLSLAIVVLTFLQAQNPPAQHPLTKNVAVGQQWQLDFAAGFSIRSADTSEDSFEDLAALAHWDIRFTAREGSSFLGEARAEGTRSAVVLFDSLDAADKRLLGLGTADYVGFVLFDFSSEIGAADFLMCVLPAHATLETARGSGYLVSDGEAGAFLPLDEALVCDVSLQEPSSIGSSPASSAAGEHNAIRKLSFAVGDTFGLAVPSNLEDIEEDIEEDVPRWNITLTEQKGRRLKGQAKGFDTRLAQLEYFTSETAPLAIAANSWILALGDARQGNLLLCQFPTHKRPDTMLEVNAIAGRSPLNGQPCQIILP